MGKKILVTGFEPFGGSDINPSGMLMDRLEAPGGAELICRVLPVEFLKSAEILREIVEKEHPDVILSIGQDGRGPSLYVERLGMNLDNTTGAMGTGSFPDNGGDAPADRPIDPQGPAAIFTRLPVWEMVKAANAAGTVTRVSYSAGAYVCNHILYTGCSLAEEGKVSMAGFVHVPFLPEQMTGEESFENGYSMPLEDMRKGIQAMLEVLA